MPEAFGLALAAAVALGAARLARTAGRAREAARAAYLDQCLPLFAAPTRAATPSGFPRLAGTYRGRRFDLQVLAHALAFRKLPALWLMVTIPAPMPVAATLDILRRPSGAETFSRFPSLPTQLEGIPGLPEDSAARTDDAAGLPPASVLAPHLPLLCSHHAKELVVSPRGVRLVWLAEEGDRGRYLLFRDAELGRVPLPAAALVPILDRLVDLAADLDALAPPRERVA
jgi:hypothetical protein